MESCIHERSASREQWRYNVNLAADSDGDAGWEMALQEHLEPIGATGRRPHPGVDVGSERLDGCDRGTGIGHDEEREVSDLSASLRLINHWREVTPLSAKLSENVG